MNRPFHKIWKETLIIAVCFILLGCFLLLKPEVTQDFFVYVTGLLILMLGVLSLFKHRSAKRMFTFDLVYAIVCITGALILFMNQEIVFQVLPWVVGIIMIVNAFMKLRFIFDLHKAGIKRWYISFILSLVKLITGMIVIIEPFSTIAVTTLIGWLVIVFAVCDVIDLVFIKMYLDEPITEKRYQRRIEEADIEQIEYED